MSLIKKGYFIVLASALLFAPPYLHADDDDDDDDRKRSRYHRKKADRETEYMLFCHCPGSPSPAAEQGPTPMPPAGRKPMAASPEGFPKETPTERLSAKERQLDLLERELADERQLLAKAMAAQGQQEIELHQKNIAAIRRELGHLYR